MDWITALGIISSIISISGAIWSLYNVRVIRTTKKEIFSKLKVVKYSSFSANTKTVINQVRKVALRNVLPRGLNLEDILNSLNDYYEKVHELRIDIEKEDSILTKHIAEFKINIRKISELDKSNPKELIETYNTIYYNIYEIDIKVVKLNMEIIKK